VRSEERQLRPVRFSLPSAFQNALTVSFVSRVLWVKFTGAEVFLRRSNQIPILFHEQG